MLARIFPRRTNLTPIDENVIVGRGPNLLDDFDEAHVSVTFSWDVDAAKRLADQWNQHCPVKIGGPAMKNRGGEFVPGMYLRQGAVITSRGCPNRCWFCSVWRREGNEVRELPIREGWNILDDNILRCSENHIRSVFEMLGRQTKRTAFTGGLEASMLKGWHVDLMDQAGIDRMFFAYDTADDLEPLVAAGKMFAETKFSRKHHLHAYCLVGWPQDTFEEAERRLRACWAAGFFPMAMLFRGEDGHVQKGWQEFSRVWARPAITRKVLKDGD